MKLECEQDPMRQVSNGAEAARPEDRKVHAFGPRALTACGGNRTRTAERLGISRRQLFDTIREYDLR